MAKPGTAATASAHTITIMGTNSLRSFITSPFEDLSQEDNSLSRELPHSPEAFHLPRTPKSKHKLFPQLIGCANGNRTTPLRSRLPVCHPSTPACRAIALPLQLQRR